MNQLEIFEKPDEIINAIDYNNNNEYHLEIGEDIIYETDDMTDQEIIDWAEDYGYLDEDEGFVDEDGIPLVDSLRDLKRSQEDEYPSSDSTPSGRAFLFFEKLNIPESIQIEVIDGLHPGNDWQGVIVKGLDNLIQLQTFLKSNDRKVNFLVK